MPDLRKVEAAEVGHCEENMSKLVGKMKELAQSRSQNRASDGPGDFTDGPSSETTRVIGSSERGYLADGPPATRLRSNESGGVDALSRGIDDLSLRKDQKSGITKPLPPVPDSSARKPLPLGSREDTSLLPDSYQTSETLGTTSSGPGQPRSVPRLPKDFDLKDSVDTDVSTEIKAPVTQERVLHDVKHVEHKVITRDLHIDHHHHIIQPVKVREVLPAAHYTLDPVTGQKVEIPAPEGWQLPSSMEPNSHLLPDTSKLRQITRSYVVDEENPDGKFDPPPAGYKEGSKETFSAPPVPAHDPPIPQATDNASTGRAQRDAEEPLAPVMSATSGIGVPAGGYGELAFTPSKGQ